MSLYHILANFSNCRTCFSIDGSISYKQPRPCYAGRMLAWRQRQSVGAKNDDAHNAKYNCISYKFFGSGL